MWNLGSKMQPQTVGLLIWLVWPQSDSKLLPKAWVDFPSLTTLSLPYDEERTRLMQYEVTIIRKYLFFLGMDFSLYLSGECFQTHSQLFGDFKVEGDWHTSRSMLLLAKPLHQLPTGGFWPFSWHTLALALKRSCIPSSWEIQAAFNSCCHFT